MATETTVAGIVPENIGTIYIGDNIRATAHNIPGRRARMQCDLDELCDSEYGEQVEYGISLNEAVQAAGPEDIVVPRGGDGSVRFAVNNLQEGAILPGRYGNASDFAVAHVGKHSLLGALRNGRRENFWSLAVTFGIGSSTETERVAGYFSTGATAAAVVDMDAAREGKFWQAISRYKLPALLYEFGLSVRALARANPYTIIDTDGQRRPVYNHTFARNPVIAKQGRIPQLDPLNREMFVHAINDKRFGEIAAGIGNLALGRLPGLITDEPFRFTVATETHSQLDGDVRFIPPNTTITVALSDTPLQVITTLPVRK